ncbi:GtrA family protein [Ruegeria sp. 2012CJ41-6]|uniref:GtrA family protein n=1 Tax=Ruegeria spongiae TaxID=2942209 RepID=A0ABT0Q2N7_9RHOB|nr:GtrA family protein [Ruegeria spongiae]MCL6284141.1 GtrA family protein [Ruegeria spongiae]
MTSARKSLNEFLRALRFAIVGLCATLIHLAVAQGLFAMGVLSLPMANLAGFALAFPAGFLGHYFLTFSRAAPIRQAFCRYGVIAMIGFLVNNIVLFSLVANGLLGEKVALAIAIIVIPMGTFLASRFWGFLAPTP